MFLLNIFLQIVIQNKIVALQQFYSYNYTIDTKCPTLMEKKMALTPEQIIAANKANMETLANLTNKAFEGVEKLVELNIQVAKTALNENVESAKQVMSARDAQQLMALQAGMVQPLAEKIMAYSRHLYNIANDTQAAFTKASDSELQQGSKKLQSMVDELTKSAPAGSEAAVQAIKQAVAAANNAYETTQKAVKQALDISQNNFKTATETAMQATANVAKKATRK